MKQRKFSPLKAAKMSRLSSKIADKVLNQRIGLKRREGKANKVSKIAEYILRVIPFDPLKYGMSISKGEKRFERSISRTAKKSILTPESIGRLHCVERCNTALGLLRKAGVKCWLARQVYYDFGLKKYRIHDYIEFFNEGKVHTLAFGISVESQEDYYAIYNFKANNILVDSGLFGMPAVVRVFRGIDSSQIGGVTNYEKLKKFLRQPFQFKNDLVEKRRLDLLVESGVMPKEALKQVQSVN
jgi:hypothetical protein